MTRMGKRLKEEAFPHIAAKPLEEGIAATIREIQRSK